MVSKLLLGSAVLSSAHAANWAFLVAGSKTYNNYRHQSDLCHAYQILVSQGFNKDNIVTMAYDDIANHEDNPFPGKVFNTPDPDGLGVDVYDGCKIDYKGDDVSAQNFLSLLLGNATTSGPTLNMGPDDDLTLLYFDHGAPGLIQFPAGDTVHASEFQTTLKTMHDQNRYGRMVIYIEACNSGSMLDGLPVDINIYGVTAVSADYPSLGTYCGYQASINNTMIGSCLGDLFAVYWMKFVSEGDGSHSLNDMFQSVSDDVASYAALHYGHEINVQYGDLSIGDLTVKDFFYGDSTRLSAPFSSPFVAPTDVSAAPRLAMDRHQLAYSEVSAMPLFHGEARWRQMLNATQDLQDLLDEQKTTQQLYWDLVMYAFPGEQGYDDRYRAWTTKSPPLHPACEKQVHETLMKFCTQSNVDVTTSYALQFHQVVVNLCSDDKLGWGANPTLGVFEASVTCEKLGSEASSLVV